jgi:hypothetical protein
MVAVLLNPPDERRPNPYHYGGDILSFKVERVLAAERTPAFTDASKQYKTRQCRANVSIQKQRDATLAISATLTFQPPKLSVRELKLAALLYFKRRYSVASFNNMPKSELLEVLAEYLVLQTFPQTAFEDQVGDKLGKITAWKEVDRRVREALVCVYPFLAFELTGICNESSKRMEAVNLELEKPMGGPEKIVHEKSKTKWTMKLRATLKKAALARWAAGRGAASA